MCGCRCGLSLQVTNMRRRTFRYTCCLLPWRASGMQKAGHSQCITRAETLSVHRVHACGPPRLHPHSSRSCYLRSHPQRSRLLAEAAGGGLGLQAPETAPVPKWFGRPTCASVPDLEKVCACACTRACALACARAHVHAHVRARVCVSVCVWGCVCVCAHMHACA